MRNRDTALYVATFWAMAIVGVACSDTTAPAAPVDTTAPPASVAVVAFTQPAPASATAGNAVSLQVEVTDRNGSPLAGMTVEWTVTAGSVHPLHTATTSRGHADAVWWVGNEPGLQTATARVGSLRATTSLSVEGSSFPPRPEDYFFLTMRMASLSGEYITEWTFPDNDSEWPSGVGATVVEFPGAPARTVASLGAGAWRFGGGFQIADVPGGFRVGSYAIGPGPRSWVDMMVRQSLSGPYPPAPLPWATLSQSGWTADYEHWIGIYGTSIGGELVLHTVRPPRGPTRGAGHDSTGADGLVAGRYAIRAYVSVWSGPGPPPGEVLLTGEFRSRYTHSLRGYADIDVIEGRRTGGTAGTVGMGHHAAMDDSPAFYVLKFTAAVPGSTIDAPELFVVEVITPNVDVGAYPLAAVTYQMYQDPAMRPATYATLSEPDPALLFLSTGGVLHIETWKPASGDEYGELSGTLELDATGWELGPVGRETDEVVQVRARFNIPLEWPD
jgi:hypothetical protein